MIIREIVNQILLVGFIQGFIFNVFSLLTSKFRTKSFLYINLWVFFLSLNNLQAWLIEKDILFQNYYLDHLHTPWYIFLAPLFYLFLTRYLRISNKNIVVIASCVFFVLSFLFKIGLLYLDRNLELDKLTIHLNIFNAIEESIGFVVTITIFIYCYQLFQRKEGFKLVRSFDSLIWINRVFILSVLILSIWLFGIIHNIRFNNDFSSNLYSLLRLTTSIFLYWIAYKGTYKQVLFDERFAIRQTKGKDNKTIVSNQKFENENSKEFERINSYIIQNQSFLNPLLSIEQLAKEIGISSNKLSKQINQKADTNFPDFINKYRVERAKELLIDNEFINYTILSIGLESGFNSKSVFYSVFKKYTGKTPKQWIKQNNK